MENNTLRNEKWYNSFTNIFALYLATACIIYLFWVSYLTVKGRVTNDIAEIKMSVISLLTLIAGFYFGAAYQGMKQKTLQPEPPKNDVVNPDKVA